MNVKPADVVGAALPLVSPAGGLLVNLVTMATSKKDEGDTSIDPKVLADTVSAIAKELAIARRIEISEEVVYEEYYGTSGGGKLAVSVNGEGAGGEIGGEAQKITKRVFTFRGFGDAPQDGNTQQVLQQLLGALPGVLTEKEVVLTEKASGSAEKKNTPPPSK